MCKTGKCSLDRCVGCELADLRAIGDTMQSTLSRVIAGLDKEELAHRLGYEGMMAILEGKSAIENWTETRKKSR